MKTFLSNLVMKWLLGSKVEAALALLPGNGAKTVISLVVTMLTVVVFMATGHEFSFLSVFEWLITFGSGLGGEVLLSKADMTLLVESAFTFIFLVHKLLKRAKLCIDPLT